MRLNWKPVAVDVPLEVSTTAYTANDTVGGLLVVDVPQVAGGGYVHAVRLVDDDDEKAALKLYLFNAKPTEIADNAAFAPGAADWKKCIGVIPLATDKYNAAGDDAIIFAAGADVNTGAAVTFGNLAGGKLYGYLVADATPTYTKKTDLALTLFLMLA